MKYALLCTCINSSERCNAQISLTKPKLAGVRIIADSSNIRSLPFVTRGNEIDGTWPYPSEGQLAALACCGIFRTPSRRLRLSRPSHLLGVSHGFFFLFRHIETPFQTHAAITDLFQPRNRRKQPARIGMLRCVEDGVTRALFDDPSVLDHHDAVGNLIDHGEIVADEQAGEAVPLLQVGKEIENLRPNSDIEGGAPAGSVTGDHWFRVNAQFHETLVSWSGNRFLTEAVRQQNNLRRMTEYADFDKLSGAHIHTAVSEHIAILDALSEGDVDFAEALLRRHIEHASRDLAEQ